MQSRQMAARLPNLGGRFILLHLNITRSCVEALNFANITLDLEPFSPDPKISLHWISFSPQFQLERLLGCSLVYIQSLKLNSLLDSNSLSPRPRWWLAFSGFKLNIADGSVGSFPEVVHVHASHWVLVEEKMDET